MQKLDISFRPWFGNTCIWTFTVNKFCEGFKLLIKSLLLNFLIFDNFDIFIQCVPNVKPVRV